MKVEKLFSGVLAVLAVLLLTGCGEVDNPRRTSLEVDTSTLTLSLGETAIRKATTKAEDYKITYTSSSPAVAMVDKSGKVTAMSEGTATITVEMAESKTSWYAAKTLTYNVVVKNTSASSAGTPGASGGKTVDLSTLTGDYVAQNGDVLKGTLAKNVKISIADCATVTLDGVTITGTKAALAASTYRFAAGSKATVTSTVGNIKKVEFTCDGSYSQAYGPDQFYGDGYTCQSGSRVGTWQGDTTTFSLNTASQVRCTQIVVTIAEDVVEEFTKAGVEDVKASIEEFTKDGRISAIRESIRRSKAVKWLVENANVTEVDEVAERMAAADSEADESEAGE